MMRTAHETALHEASHVLARRARNLSTPHRVEIVAEGSAAGRTLHRVDDMPVDDAGLGNEIVSALAGWAVALKRGFVEPAAGCDWDREQARQMAAMLDAEHPEEIVASSLALARGVVDNYGPAITRLAATLLANGGSIEAEHNVRLATRAAIEGWPTPDLSVDARHEALAEIRELFECDYLPLNPIARSRWSDEQRTEAWHEAERDYYTGSRRDTSALVLAASRARRLREFDEVERRRVAAIDAGLIDAGLASLAQS